MSRRTKILLLLFTACAVTATAAIVIYFSLQNKITARLAKGSIIPRLELYSQGMALSLGRHVTLAALQEELNHNDLRADRDYFVGEADACARVTGLKLKETSQHCLWIKKTADGALLIAWDEQGWIQELWSGEPWTAVTSYALFPRLITQFFDGQPILQQDTSLSEVPLACLQAVTAIEDREFLEHNGVSASGSLRAVLRNLRAGRWAEGGSTITQQLVKNFFLTSKKTIRRKLEEQLLALMLEAQLSKDQILEMYLNVIYMGQNGPYQVRGLGSAAVYYFDKPVARLDLGECALLAALINNPGRYSPFTHPSPATTRRGLVLHKMFDAQMINAKEENSASAKPLPTLAEGDRHSHAPYLVMSALREFAGLGLEAEEGAKLYTTLDPELQNRMSLAAEKELPAVAAKIKNPAKEPLQVAALTIDLTNAQIVALIGGRDFRATQFNRAVDSRRQIGSIVKPFVYYPALNHHDPTTAVLDAPFEWKTGKQVWRPKNFEPKNFGEVPYFFALAHSLNIPAARVGQEVGLDAIVGTLHASGVAELIPELPSLTLGAVELSPLEVAQGYFTLARFGHGEQIHTLLRVEDHQGRVLYSHRANADFSLDPIPTAVLVGMMEQTMTIGTAQMIQTRGLSGAFAGKTGSTSDTKDAWFAGFSPRLLTVVWVGYDNNTVLGLTGAGAALPVWTEVMKAEQPLFAATGFAWPEGVRVDKISRASLLEKFPELKGLPEEVELVFAR